MWISLLLSLPCMEMCSSYKLFHEEVLLIGEVLRSNLYASNFVDSCVQRFLNCAEDTTVSCKTFGPEKMKVFVSLPFAGLSSLKLCRQLKRIYKALFPCVELLVVFKPSLKLSTLCKLKSPFS